MKTKEAIERVRSRFNKWALDEEDLTALQTLGLVDADSEDERIRKEIVDFICWAIGRGSITKEQRERSDTWFAYLEKLKDQKPAQYDLDVLEKHITKDSISELAHTVIVRNGWDIVEQEQKPVEWGKYENLRRFLIDYFGFIESTLSDGMWKGFQIEDILDYLEKQKDANKAIEAVERIDKYIDEHTANAHDMDDSNPDKKYYRGVDDTLSNIAGILNSAYSEEKPKEQKDYNKLYEDIAKSGWFKKGHEGKSLGCDYEQKEQKPAEWSGKDEDMLRDICSDLLAGTAFNIEFQISAKEKINWLKTRLKSCHPQPKQEWSEEDEHRFEVLMAMCDDGQNESLPTSTIYREMTETKDWLKNRLKSLRPQPHWKPSEYTLSLVKKVADGEMLTGVEQMAMGTVYERLKSLYE